jgi:hypothetical protein
VWADVGWATEPSPELVGLLGRLRAALVGYVGARRREGAALERVLAEVQELARAAAVAEGWCDLTDLLVPQAIRWTREAYAAGPAGSPAPPCSRTAAPEPTMHERRRTSRRRTSRRLWGPATPRRRRLPPARTLSRTTRMSLRRVLHAYRDGWLPEARLAASAGMVAGDARRCGLPAARMLVALKAEWSALEEVRRLAMLEARGPAELLERLVTLAIRAYYADGAGPAGPGPVGDLAVRASVRPPPARMRRAVRRDA